jgi:predicted metal-dependent hydrolase
MSTKLTVRHPGLKFSEETPLHYFDGNPFVTQLINAFHIVFPAGEKFFIRSVRRYMDEVKDPQTRKNIKDFIAQEIVHGNEHEKFWDVMRSQGIPVDSFRKFYETTAYDTIEPLLLKLFGVDLGLSTTAALEHYTAMLAELAFEEDVFAQLPEELSQLLMWHAAEELEHKEVAFDLLKDINDSYSLRMGGYALGTMLLWTYGFGGMLYFLSQDNEFKSRSLLDKVKDVGSMFKYLGSSLGKNWIDYLRPDFHPNDIDNLHLAEEFFANFKGKKVS